MADQAWIYFGNSWDHYISIGEARKLLGHETKPKNWPSGWTFWAFGSTIISITCFQIPGPEPLITESYPKHLRFKATRKMKSYYFKYKTTKFLALIILVPHIDHTAFHCIQPSRNTVHCSHHKHCHLIHWDYIHNCYTSHLSCRTRSARYKKLKRKIIQNLNLITGPLFKSRIIYFKCNLVFQQHRQNKGICFNYQQNKFMMQIQNEIFSESTPSSATHQIYIHDINIKMYIQ